jgi:hypothetical protein
MQLVRNSSHKVFISDSSCSLAAAMITVRASRPPSSVRALAPTLLLITYATPCFWRHVLRFTWHAIYYFTVLLQESVTLRTYRHWLIMHYQQCLACNVRQTWKFKFTNRGIW